MNYILGIGALGVPYAFQSAGLYLSLVTTVFSCLLSFITVMFIVETHSRAMLLSSSKGHRSRSVSNVAQTPPNSIQDGSDNFASTSPEISSAVSHFKTVNSSSMLQPLPPDRHVDDTSIAKSQTRTTRVLN